MSRNPPVDPAQRGRALVAASLPTSVVFHEPRRAAEPPDVRRRVPLEHDDGGWFDAGIAALRAEHERAYCRDVGLTTERLALAAHIRRLA